MFVLKKITALAILSFVPAALLAQAGQSSRAVAVGTVKAIQGSNISLHSDAGADVSITVDPAARVLRMAPGQTDLKTATPIQLTDVQNNDRILARGASPDNGKTITATTIVVMKQSDVAAKQKTEEEDWQRNGVFGPVKAVDPAAGTIMLGATVPGAPNVTVQTSKDTVVRKYAADSAKFDDAKPSAVSDVKPGDQLRARGTRGADNTSLTAKEIVFGTFRNVAGKIAAIDPANQTVTVDDLSTKKPVVVKITADSTMRKLPQQMAQFIALRLRDGGAGGGAPAGGPGGQRFQAAGGGPGGARQGGPAGPGAGMRGDPMQMLARLPQIPLTDLQKGDALMVVTTQGDGTTVSALTLLAGVEPILTAPNAQSILSPWNMNTGGGGGDTQ